MTELSTEEAAVVQRFEEGADAEESLRERVIDAIRVLHAESVGFSRPSWAEIADAAIAVIRGDS